MKMLIHITKMHDIIEDLKLQLVPYYQYYFNLVKTLEDEYIHKNDGDTEKALRSATLFDLK